MEQTDIGFVAECEPWLLESRFFPSKIGGQPAWLNLKDLPTANQVKCRNCEKPCLFLCQIYAPDEDIPEAFHRTIFVFICKDEKCCKANDNGNLHVLRSQLPRENSFYPFDAPEERENWRPDLKASKFTKVCRVCSLSAPAQCAKCKNVNYCCREHQIVDWNAGHKNRCTADDKSNENLISVDNKTLANFLFPEFELEMERDITKKSDKNKQSDENLRIEMKNFEKLVESGMAGTLQSENGVEDVLSDLPTVKGDKTFTKFKKTVERNPEQVLRYDRGGCCLYISSENQLTDVPKCDECNGERQFEFQIMPQLLIDLGFENTLNSLDWGILAVFTCKNSCTPKSGYVPEFIWKQDIVE